MFKFKINKSMIHGSVEPGFEEVKEEFINNFEKGEEVGAAFTAYYKGKKVVDLWGGYRDAKTKDPWKEDTLVLVFSTTKGISGLACALAHSKGYFEYDEKVSKYWPKFAQNDKDNITVRQLLSHKAGLCAIDEPLDINKLGDPDKMKIAIEKQKPLWEPGKMHGYHGITLGWYESELIRKTDPQHRTIGQFFRDEIAKPLGLEIYIGLPDDVPDHRIANLYSPFYKFRMIFNTDKYPKPFVKAFMKKGTITNRTFSNPKVLQTAKNYNTRELRKIELPAANGIVQVREVAKLYSIFASGGKELNIKTETMNALMEPAAVPDLGSLDQVLQINLRYSLGFLKPSVDFHFGTDDKAFGTSGTGGSFGCADPATQSSYCYAMNNLGFYIIADPREKILADTFFKCIKNL
ncbi:MAG: serine hydrolase domain-containing protein [Candidatus Odinarchaeota archaeon]